MPYKDPNYKRKYNQQHYLAHKEEHIKRAKANAVLKKERLRIILRDAKAKPCADCGVQYPFYVMQFDHLGDKEFTVASFPNTTGSPSRLLREIAKCEVVCANCHAERTYQRQSHWH